MSHPALRTGSVALAFLLAACTAGTRSEPPAAEPGATPAEPAATTPEDKDLTAALMAAEFAWQDGRGAAAAKHFLRAATLSPDPKIAEHATRVALVSKQYDLADEAVARWRALDPKALGIWQADAVLAMQRGKDE
ncbi:MAG TPA: hypothetical protein VFL14_15655, partial [Xanthomonadales bacterium]|nr:hypothetical protein [Xanthomonadales bacterium]